jgi:hypothetical protein
MLYMVVCGTVHWTIEPEKLKFQILVVWACRDGERKQARPARKTRVVIRFFIR